MKIRHNTYFQVLCKLGFLISFSVFCANCSDKKGVEIATQDVRLSNITDVIKVDLDSIEEGVFSSLFDSVGYLLLEHKDEIPLVGNMKTVLSNEYIYIEDNEFDHLFQYDRFGNLQTVFKSSGSGPGEFAQIEDYQVINDTIIIMDRVSAKLIYFDRHGNYIKEFFLKEGASNFHVGMGYKLLFYSGFPNDEGMVFLRMGEDGMETPYFPLPPNSTRGAVRLLNGFVSDEVTDMLSVTVPYTYDVAFIDSTGYLNEIKRFEFENITIVEDPPHPNSIQPEKIHVFFPFPKFYFVTQFFNRIGYYLLFDRNFKLNYAGNKLKNDLDGMNFHVYPLAFFENRLVLYFDATSIYNLYKSSENHIKEKYPNAAIHSFVSENNEDLQDDRHVLVFLKFRSDLEDEVNSTDIK